jgi:hypothetical protein
LIIFISHSLDVTLEFFTSGDCTGTSISTTQSYQFTACNDTSFGPLKSSIKTELPFLSGTIVSYRYATSDCTGDVKDTSTIENKKCLSNILGSTRVSWVDIGAILFYIAIGIVAVVVIVAVVFFVRRKQFVKIR